MRMGENKKETLSNDVTRVHWSFLRSNRTIWGKKNLEKFSTKEEKFENLSFVANGIEEKFSVARLKLRINGWQQSMWGGLMKVQ